MEEKKLLPWPSGLKRTKPRELVWEALCAADRPLSVTELFARLEPSSGMAVSTVYRVLTALEEHGAVTKTTMMGEEIALFALNRGGHKHYAICLACHRQVPVRHCPFETAPVEREAEGFTVTNHRLELYGYCRECLKKRREARGTNGGPAPSNPA